eukprot:1802662-Amphidinium_carterae.1
MAQDKPPERLVALLQGDTTLLCCKDNVCPKDGSACEAERNKELESPCAEHTSHEGDTSCWACYSMSAPVWERA